MFFIMKFKNKLKNYLNNLHQYLLFKKCMILFISLSIIVAKTYKLKISQNKFIYLLRKK